MLRRILLSLTASLFIFTNVTPAHAFHGGQGSSGALAARADIQSGSANFGVPIDVPPGRAGIQPNLQLQYSSSLPNGLLGVGWSLELGSIQRSAKKGVPSYTDSDTFVLVQSGRGPATAYDPTAGFYRAKVEGAFMRIQKSGSAWVVTDKKGIKYHFGTTPGAQEYDPNTPSKIFKWSLSSVEDLQGNTMTITYWRDGNKLYPQYIDYTSNPQNSLPSFARVEFLWSARPDIMSGYTAGFLMETNYRLNRVNAWIGTDLQYRFDLTYHASNATGRSLVDTITQYGADGSSTLPPLTFLYQEYVNQPVPAYNAVTTSLTNSSTNNNQFFGDFNGDGRTDRALYDQSAGNLHVALSTGAGFQSPSVWYGNFASGVKFLSGNFDSDGVTDLCVFNPSSGNWDVFSSNGQNQFVSKGTWISGFGANKEPSAGDFNGDGLTDIASIFEQAGEWSARIALNTGTSFAVWTARDFIIGVARTGEDDHPFAADFNGDGLTDFGSYAKTSGNWRFALHPGSLDKSFDPLAMIPNFGNTKNFIVSDFDSDGLADIGYYSGDVQKVIYRLSNGKTFESEQSLFLGWNVPAVQSVDFNGDGLPDFVPVETGAMKVNYSSGVFPDLLDKSNNGVGATTTIEYAPSTTFNNPQLPFPLQLVKSAGQSNNLGDVYTTRYEYAEGLWDGADREFRGFGTVKVTDPDGNYSESTFLQDDIFKGRVSEQRAYDSAGRLFSKTVNTWDPRSIISGVNFVYLKRQDGYVYDGDSTGRRTAQEFYYDETPQAGNLTKTVQLGEVGLVTGADIPGDSRSVETSYVSNVSSWIFGLPNLTTVKDTSGQTVRQSRFYYDNQGNTTAPVKGLLTKKEDWAGTGNVNPVTLYSYDAIGNLLTTTDPKGNVTSIAYDPTYKMFPLTTENALAHKVVNEYYGVNGVALSGGGVSGLWGQVKSTTDPNQQQGKRSYDVFGRVTTTIAPLDSLAYPTQTTAIQYFSDYTKVTSRQRIKSGQAQTIDAVSFYDGLGRLIQTKTPSEVLGRYVVGGQAGYDSRGLKNKQYLPYFSTNPVDTIEPINSVAARSTIEYDAMGRPVRTINPDGTYASAAYDDWSTTAVNENGHKQASYFDAWGRLIKKEEYTGADGRSPNYSAQAYALYATTLYSYDLEGNLIQTKDAYNNITAITYDALGRKTAMTDPDMGHWSYQYDLNGNLTRQIDAKGQTLTFTYDALNRLTNKTDGVNGTVNVSYTYDNAAVTNSKGRLTQAAYTGGNTQFAYDELGRELQSIKAMNTTNYSVNRSYDALNRLLNIQYPDQKGVFYKYSAAGQIESVANDQTLFPVVGLNPPELGAVQPGDAKVQISWTTVPGATGYRVKYGTSSGSYTTTSDVGNVTGVIISGLTNDIPYYFAMVAYNADAESGVSNERAATPMAPPVLLLSFDGKDAAVNTTDLTGRHAITFNGNAQLDAAQKRSGTASLLLDGNGDYLTSADHDDWNLGTEEFTIDFFVRWTGSVPNDQTFFSQATAGADGNAQYVQMYKDSSGSLGFVVRDMAGNLRISFSGPWSPVADTWYHLAVVKSGSNSWKLYVNGTNVASTLDSQTAIDNYTGVFAIGCLLQNGVVSNAMQGWIDEFRISKGIARWTSDFTPLYAFNMEGNASTSYSALRASSFNEGRETTDEGRTVFATIANWFERHVLGVSDAYAQAATTDLVTLEAENMPTKTAGGLTTGGWNIWSNGYIQQTVTFPNTRTYEFEIIAKGSSAAGVWPNMQLRIDQNSTGNITVNSINWASYIVQVNIAAGNHAIAAAFTNDLNVPPEDRNLKVDKIIVREILPNVLPPAVPVLNAPTSGNGQISLSWAAATGAAGYKIYYGTSAGVYGTPTDVGNVTTKAVTGLTNGTAYYFAVTAYNAGGESVRSNERSATPVSASTQLLTTLEAETMPTKTTGGATTGGWNIWSNGYIEDTITFPRSGTYEFEVVARGSIAAGVWPNMQLRLDQVSKADTTVNTTAWKSYIKQVSVTSGSHKVAVAFTNDYKTTTEDRNLYVDKVIIREITSSPPSAPVLNTATAGNAQVSLSWAAATGATGYKIYYGTASGVYGAPITVGNMTTSTVTGLTNGTTYYFAVSATNTGGESVRSNEKSVTPAAPMTENPTLFIKNVDYNASGQMTKVELGNGDVTTYMYNSLNLRLTRLYTVNAQLQAVQDLNYTYDSAGNILSITDNVNTADQTFKYDELNRLVEAVNPNPGRYGTKTYTYDKIGNIVAKDGKTYFYGGTSGGPHAVTALSDGTTFSYDANGNMITKTEGGAANAVTTAYTYDAENRLTKVIKNGGTIGQYEYDGDGGRTRKTATVSGQTTTTTFVGSLFETSGSRTTKFIFLGGQRVAAVTTSPSTGSTTLYYHADHLGGANVLTDATGFKKELIEYEPFGLESRHEKYGSSEEVAWYYFTGKKTDDESGLIYFGARYYDPKLGRFITADDIIQNPTDPQTLNRYSYTSNNPVNRTDPTGHGWLQKFFKQVSKIFDNVVNWLEKVTNSKWSVDIEVGQTYQFQDAKTVTESVGKTGFTLITQPWQVGVGFKNWLSAPMLRILETMYDPAEGPILGSSIENGDWLFVNGILNDEVEAIKNANRVGGVNKVAYNPSDGPVADLVEAFLQKLTFTSSFDRQLAKAVVGHRNIGLVGHSQGAIIISNTLVNLGFRGQRNVVDYVRYINTQISQPRAFLSAALGGTKNIDYGNRSWDPSNIAGPNIDPVKFTSGIIGLVGGGFGVKYHGIPE